MRKTRLGWRLICVLLMAAGPLSAMADDVSVFGVYLGRPVVLPECPVADISSRGQKFYKTDVPSPCLWEASKVNGYGAPIRRLAFPSKEKPLIMKNEFLYLIEQDGVLVGMHFVTAGVSTQNLVMEQLVAKFGSPRAKATRSVQNSYGAQYDAIDADWQVGQVDVFFAAVTGRIDLGEVFIDLPAAVATRKAWRAADRGQERKL